MDRNEGVLDAEKVEKASLSARRAWIEIDVTAKIGLFTSSLSARRAWIEMISGLRPLIASVVALRKESVDRNRKNQNL